MASRKSNAHLKQVKPKTHHDFVEEKFEPGNYVLTVAGCTKIVGVILLAATLALVLSSKFCEEENALRISFASVTGATVGVMFILYFIFSMGWIVKRAGMWVRIDIFTTLILSIATIVVASICLTTCDKRGSMLNKVPAPLGITGCAILMIACGALFVFYRYSDDETGESLARRLTRRLSVRSIFA